MELGGRHWVTALLFAVVVHAAVAAAILWAPQSSGAESDGRGGIEVLLSPEGGTPGNAAAVASDVTEAEPVEVADALSEAPLEPESSLQDTAVLDAAEPVSQPAEADILPTPPVEDAVPMDDVSEVAEIEDVPNSQLAAEPLEIAETLEPTETAEPLDLAQADPPPSQTTEVAEAVAMVEAEAVQDQPVEQAPEAEKPAAVTQVQPMEEVAARTVFLPPVPRQKPPVPKPVKANSKAKSEAKTAAKPAPQRSRAGTSAGAASASRGEVSNYSAQVRARIASRRPATAAARGKVVVSFAISASGALQYARVSRSSGQRSLDQAALSAVQRSSPFPRPPQGMTSQQLTYAVPFEFR